MSMTNVGFIFGLCRSLPALVWPMHHHDLDSLSMGRHHARYHTKGKENTRQERIEEIVNNCE